MTLLVSFVPTAWNRAIVINEMVALGVVTEPEWLNESMWLPEWMHLAGSMIANCSTDSISLYGSNRVDDAFLRRVLSFHRPIAVRAANTMITDEGARALMSMASIEELDLGETQITSAAFDEHSMKRSSLRELRLSSTSICDEACYQLSQCARLEILYMANCRVGSGGVGRLCGCDKLRVLVISGTQITDAIGPSLSCFRGLEEIDVSDTQVSDAIVPFLVSIATLKRVFIRRTRVTEDGVQLLRERSPDVAVNWSH